MSDQVMNQDELDALLRDAGMSDDEKSADAAETLEAEGADGDEGTDAIGDEQDTDLTEWGLDAEDTGAGAEDGKSAAPAPPSKNGPPSNARDLRLGNLGGKGGKGEKPRELEFILDIPLQLTVEVGRTSIEIGDLLSLGPGSIVELDKLAGEPLEVFANNKLVARGEAVIVNEKFGIRLTDVVSKHDRIENLH